AERTAAAAGARAANAPRGRVARPPTALASRGRSGPGWYDLTASPRTDLPWKVTAVQIVFDEPVATGTVQSLTGLTASRLTGLGTNTLTWTLASPIVKGSFNTGLASAGADAVRDAAGKPVGSFSQAFTVLWGDVNGDGVVDALDETGVRASLAGPFRPAAASYNPFADLSGDGIVNLIDVGIARSRKGTSLP